MILKQQYRSASSFESYLFGGLLTEHFVYRSGNLRVYRKLKGKIRKT